MKSNAKPADLAQVQRQEIKEQGSFCFGGKRNQLSCILRANAHDLMDILQVRCFAAQTRSIVDDLTVNFPGNVIDERQFRFLSQIGARVSGPKAPRVPHR
jgi:hypothetical protein